MIRQDGPLKLFVKSFLSLLEQHSFSFSLQCEPFCCNRWDLPLRTILNMHLGKYDIDCIGNCVILCPHIIWIIGRFLTDNLTLVLAYYGWRICLMCMVQWSFTRSICTFVLHVLTEYRMANCNIKYKILHCLQIYLVCLAKDEMYFYPKYFRIKLSVLGYGIVKKKNYIRV